MKRFTLVLVTAAVLSPLSGNSAVVGDIDQDGKIDLIEAIYALQIASGVYPTIDDSCLLTGQGAWETGVSYNICDVSTHLGSTYVCTTAHTSLTDNIEPPDTAYWTVLSTNNSINWSEINNRPAGLDDGDDVGISIESDPTVAESVKDGVSWNEVTEIPTGFADGTDDVGTETDPEVGANQANYVPRWNGSALVKGYIFDNGNNIGIGTSSPTQKLDVRGNIAVTGTVDGRDIASDGAALDSLASSGSADSTNDSWTGIGDVYTTAGTVSIGTSNSDGHQLKVRSTTSGKAAVQAIGQYPFLTTYNTSVIGQLAVQDPGGLAVPAADVGVLGSVPNFGGSSSVGVYGSNSSVLTSSSNYGVYALANGTGTSAINYGLYATAANGQSNWAGYFDGNTRVEGNFEVSNKVLINDTGTSSGLTIGNGQSVAAQIYHTASALRVEGPNDRVQFGSSEYIEDCGSYCVELSSASTASGVVQIIGDTTVTGNITLKSPSTGDVLLELGEGLDYAEGFNVSDTSEIVSGTVLIIDPENPGQLTTSRDAYDSRVAGIVAGANGLGSGVRLGVENFDTDVALAGRVYCQVEAMQGPIKPGDLLTTSEIAGHAMKATDFHRAQGAILGKAMERLPQGKTGKILVLVSLQ